jgi:hypothetical protein
MDISFDSKAPSIVIEVKEYKNGYNDIRRRDRKIRAITEITKDNANHCKELMKIVDDLRHLDGMKKSEIQMQYFKYIGRTEQ